MYENTSVGVVIPAYNEEGFVSEVIETLPTYVDRVYVVDDCSTDGTWDEICAAAERDDDEPAADGFDRRIVPIQHEQNRGVGGAIKTGYQRARSDEIGVTAVMGGDGQMDPDELEKVIAPVVDGAADYVKGNRLLTHEDREEMPGFRYVGNVLLSYLTKIASGYWFVGDPQNGYTAISLAALEGAGIDDMFEFYGYCNDLIVRLSTNGYTVMDVPVAARYRDEESHIDYRTYVPLVSLMLLRTFLWRLTTRRSSPAERIRTWLYVGGAGAAALAVLSTVRSALGAGDTASVQTVSPTINTDGGRPTVDSEATDPEATDAEEERSIDPDEADGPEPAETEEGADRALGVRATLFAAGLVSVGCGILVDALLNRSWNGVSR